MSAPIAGGHYRVVVPAPDGGWLALRRPEDGVERLALGRDWRESARRAAIAAGVPYLGRARLVAEVRLTRQESGLNAAEDVRPSLTQVRGGLIDAGVVSANGRSLIDERMVLGSQLGDRQEPLMVVHLWGLGDA